VNPWEAIIGVPRGQESFYDKLPAMNGFVDRQPGKLYDAAKAEEVEIYFVKGQKKIRRIKKPTKEEKQLTRDEGLESVENMYRYLFQYNKKKDKLAENAQLAELDALDDDVNVMKE
jgi:hypothetical protein